ncbi:hypothetical protein KHM83_16840 [Fusibacter paucivorans]|uniref:Uncharacterized protein n=1 Tax=Fusibacter paucivorans TaxID=76009 RepID=A0ABS5PT71_9FIRM|nr:hypothetical protein [Fusibacter paucivorans]MBS7528358.1 hypothetical protein [Fusibacter paucivorans]
MNRRERVLVVVVIILLTVMGIKSIAFDSMIPANASEEQMVGEMQAIIEAKHDGILYDSGLMKTRILAVKQDDGVLKGHYRKYALWIFPMGDEYYDASEE